MPRPLKYQTVDDLLDNCQIMDDCYLWPESATVIPMLGPNSPVAKKFGTVSVVRILFTICRYIPMGRRLVRRCNQPMCVNPFHYTEAQSYLAKRAKLPDRNGLFPQQEETRHLIAPPDEELEKMRPVKQFHIKRLMDAASTAGHDCEGLGENKRYIPPRLRQPNYANDKPVLVIKGHDHSVIERLDRRNEPAKKLTDEEWAEIESGFKKKSLPEVVDEIDHDVEHTSMGTVDIFEAIRRRKEWEQKK